MPNSVPIPPPKIASTFHVNRVFKGLSAAVDDADVFSGYVTRADNLRCRFGKLVTRPGRVGQLATPFGNPAYLTDEYRNADGTTSLIVHSGGRVYRLLAGNTAATEISLPDSGAYVSANAQGARLGHYEYEVDGVHALIRIDEAGGSYAVGINANTAAATAALTHTHLLDPGDGTLLTDAIASPSANIIAHTDVTNTTYWDQEGTPSTSTQNGAFLWIDQAGDGVKSKPLLPPTFTTDTAKHADYFRLTFDILQGNEHSETQGGTVNVYAYSDTAGTSLLTVLSFPFQPEQVTLASNQSKSFAFDLDFTGLAAEIGSLKVEWVMPTDHHFGGCAVGNPSLTTFGESFGPLTASADGSVTLTAGSFPYVAGVLRCAGYGFEIDLGSSHDWSGDAHVFVRMAYAAALKDALGLVMTFRQTGSADTYASNPLALDNDGGAVDLTAAIPPAILASFRYVGLAFTSDLPLPSQGAFLTVGEFLNAGRLSVGTAASPISYVYTFTEVDDATGLESNAAPDSNAITPTVEDAEGRVVFPAKANTITDRYNVWRRGGVFPDNEGRLLGTVNFANDTVDNNAGGVTWDHTTRTLTDNTPDSALETATSFLETGHDPPPVGASAICAWQGRIWLVQGGRLFASSLVQYNAQAALYFNEILLPDDPLAKVKGDVFNVGLDDNDPAVALVPIGTNAYFSKGFLCVLKRSSVLLVSGTDPTNFSLQTYLIGSGIGCAAPKSACLVGNHVWFLSTDGLYQFNADIVDPKTVTIERAIMPPTNAGGCDPSAWAKAAAVWHDRRYYLALPAPGGSVNSVAFVWDSRVSGEGRDGWTKDTVSFTSGRSLSGGSAAGQVFFGGLDGQIYAEAGEVDKATPSAGGTGIAYALATRGLGQEGEGEDYFREKQAGGWYAEINTAQTGGTVTAGVIAENGTWTAPHYLKPAGGVTHIRKEVPSSYRGRFLTVTLAGTATKRHEIQAFGTPMAAGSIR